MACPGRRPGTSTARASLTEAPDLRLGRADAAVFSWRRRHHRLRRVDGAGDRRGAVDRALCGHVALHVDGGDRRGAGRAGGGALARRSSVGPSAGRFDRSLGRRRGDRVLSQFLLHGVASPVLDAMAPVPAVVAVTAIAFLLPSLFAGAVAPLATVLALRAAPESAQGRIVGRMYALGAIGAIAGVLLGGLALLPFLGAARSVAVIAAAYVVAVALAVSGPARIASVAAAALLLGATVAFGAAWSPCARESGYFCVRVDVVSPGVRVLALDHLGHGANDRDDPERLHIPYVALIDALARKRFGTAGPRSAFFIGGGAYTLPRAWAVRWPRADLTVAEIDPQVTRAAREDLWFDGEMRIVHRDARAALVGETGPFDAVIGDAFADISIPPHLVTDEFFAMSAAKLSPDGVFAMNVVDFLRKPRFLLSLAQTLRRSFPVVELWLDEAAVSPGEARTTWIVPRGANADRQGSCCGRIRPRVGAGSPRRDAAGRSRGRAHGPDRRSCACGAAARRIVARPALRGIGPATGAAARRRRSPPMFALHRQNVCCRRRPRRRAPGRRNRRNVAWSPKSRR